MAGILVFGRSGQVARELERLGAERGLAMTFAGRERLDLASDDPAAVLESASPAAVINAAAYTAVDKAESEPDAAFALNRDAPGRLARLCAARDIPFVHFSTDYVFPGDKPEPYVEDDARGPRSVYGRSKAEGEDGVIAAGGRFAILRTAWVFGAFGQNFVRTMLRLSETREEVGVVADQLGRPTWSRDAAEAALHAVERLTSRPDLAGVYHVAGADDATWADLAEATFELAGRPTRVKRITTADYPTPAARPANSRLDSGRFAAVTNWRPRPWRKALAAALKDMETNA